jgi:cobalamin biosynthesis protein CbiG
VLGLGWHRASAELLERAVRAVLAEHDQPLDAVVRVATLDRRGGDPALALLLERLGCALRLYSAEELAAVPGVLQPSAEVLRHVGAPSVAEAAALLGAGASSLLLSKQIYREGEASLTLALACIPFAPGGEAA